MKGSFDFSLPSLSKGIPSSGNSCIPPDLFFGCFDFVAPVRLLVSVMTTADSIAWSKKAGTLSGGVASPGNAFT